MGDKSRSEAPLETWGRHVPIQRRSVHAEGMPDTEVTQMTQLTNKRKSECQALAEEVKKLPREGREKRKDQVPLLVPAMPRRGNYEVRREVAGVLNAGDR